MDKQSYGIEIFFHIKRFFIPISYSDLPPKAVEAITISLKAPTGTIEFRDDIDVLEQV